mgnify:FL=1
MAVLSTGYSAAHTCGTSDDGPVLGGVDVVVMRNLYQVGVTDAIPNKYLGSQNISSTYGGVEFWFMSEDNQQFFVKDPVPYLPQFGGYCAWGLTGYDSHVTDPSG